MPPRISTRTRDRNQAKQQQKTQPATGVLAVIERNGKILLQRRREHIADAGMWVLPGGQCRPAEEAHQTIVRICAEELGITVRPSTEIGTLQLTEGTCPIWHVLWKGKDVTLTGQDIVAIGWFTPEELLELTPVREEAALRTFVRENEQLQKILVRATETSSDAAAMHAGDTHPDEIRVLKLVARAKQDDHEAFAEIYDLYAVPIHRYVSFRLPSALAEDTVADIFVKAWEKLESFTGRKGIPFSAWLFRIARNIVIDTYRTRKETVLIEEVHADEDRWNDPKLAMKQEIQAKILRSAMNKLPHRYREVLLLSFMANLDHAEIARTMRIREGAVRILKHRALKKLESLLPPSMREELP